MTSLTSMRGQSRFPARTQRESTPACYNIAEGEASYVLSVDLPGLEQSSIDIQVEKGVLTIKAERVESQPEGFKQVYGEFKQRSYQHQFSIGDLVEVEDIKARYDRGVLFLNLPKKAKAIARKIQVSVA